MRFLALESNIRALKKRFMVEGEEELLSSSRHVFAFLIPLLWIIPAAVLALIAWGAGVAADLDVLVLTGILYFVLAGLFAAALHGFIEWRYNFIVITTEKIVIVDHRFIFSQSIRPVPLDTIATTDVGSQYFGLGNCGFVNLHLSEVKQGTNKEFRLDRLPKPDVIAGVIENARALKGQRSPPDKGTAEQASKVEEVQEKTAKDIPVDATGAPPPPEPPPPPPPPPENAAGVGDAQTVRKVVLTGQGHYAQLPDGEVVEVVQPNDALDAPASPAGSVPAATDVLDG
jgi:hypothetical protein